MADVIADRVVETSTTTGTGNLALAGAVAGFRAFDDVCANGDTVPYCIEAVDGDNIPTGEWEVGEGTFNDTDTLVRTTVLASSNSGSAVNFSAGTKRVTLCVSAARLIRGASMVVTTTGTSADLSPSNAGKYDRWTNAGAKTLTVQPDGTTAQPVDGEWHIRNAGAADLTIVAGGGVTINPPADGTLVVANGGTVTLKRVATDVFDLVGQTVAA